jgi:hypothetical protein
MGPALILVDVDDIDEIYRFVGPRGFNDDGKLSPSRAFAWSSDQNISVDLAKLCGNNPEHALKKPEGFVYMVVVGAVKAVEPPLARYEGVGAKQRPIGIFQPDVRHDPDSDNYAHAIIVINPDPSNGAIEKLQSYLARIASRVFP